MRTQKSGKPLGSASRRALSGRGEKVFGKSGLWSFAVGQVDVLPGGGAGRSIAAAGTADQGIEPETSDLRVPDRNGVAARGRVAGQSQACATGAAAGRAASSEKGAENEAEAGWLR